ncbi:MAG: hypothetical protein SangKO_036430 [Sandaracinaceae bacterium]
MWSTIPHRPAVEGLAMIADEPVETCRDRGARWTFERVLARRLTLQTIMVVMRASGGGIAYGKTLVTVATPEWVTALGARRVDARLGGAERAPRPQPDGRLLGRGRPTWDRR